MAVWSKLSALTAQLKAFKCLKSPAASSLVGRRSLEVFKDRIVFHSLIISYYAIGVFFSPRV